MKIKFNSSTEKSTSESNTLFRNSLNTKQNLKKYICKYVSLNILYIYKISARKETKFYENYSEGRL